MHRSPGTTLGRLLPSRARGERIVSVQDEAATPSWETFLRKVQDPRLVAILRIQTALLDELQRFATERGFVQLMPILLSPFTDPLNHDVYPAEIEYRGRTLKLTASMIFHKQLALASGLDRIFIVSPNVRLEKLEIKESVSHLAEFSQFDFEIRDAGMEDVLSFLEELYLQIFAALRQRCAGELAELGRELPELRAPFPRYRAADLRRQLGDGYYEAISLETPGPCFLLDFEREFYDREDSERPGTYRNFDMVYAQGYGEALSGAEREHRYADIVRRMERRGMPLAPYTAYLEVARRGALPPSAGAGIGIQRLLRFLCGTDRIADVCLFDRSLSADFTF
ncbi:MAG TPA: asparagine synthetase A [Thermoanaerobaculia bacterium]|nr:asparagine synthetase A [Thermoanaerobaculia bacterium]